MNDKEYMDTLKGYQDTLTALSNKCADAEKEVIVAETNLNNMKKQLDDLVKEAEALAGCSIDDIPAIIEKQKQKLSSVMDKLSAIDLNDKITQRTLDEVYAVKDILGNTL